MIFAVILFAITYTLLLIFPKYRAYTAMASAAVFVITGILPIGASANIAGLGILRKEGYEVKPLQFMKISVPFTIIAVLSGYILVWLIWS